MECPQCKHKVSGIDVKQHRCPSCSVKIYWWDKMAVAASLSCDLLAILAISHWFPRDLDIGAFILLCGLWFVVSFSLLVVSLFALPPKVDLVPGQGPIRLDI
jgi:hypothetical protein